MSSDAVGLEQQSAIVGWKVTKGVPAGSSSNLIQRVAILGEANADNQGTLNLEPKEITSSQQAGSLYGIGSPIYHAARILHPRSGAGIGGIPTIVYPQAEATGAAARVVEITPAGTATKNGTHILEIAHRQGIDGEFYNINIETGDTVAEINTKIADAVNAILASPVSAVAAAGETTLTTKWKGLTAEEVQVSVNLNDQDLGITYGVAVTANGAGTPSISDALNLFGNIWNTVVINPYTNSATLDVLETFNGRPDPVNPTGRYTGIIYKPFRAITGFLTDDPTTVTDARKDEVTIAVAPAPLSKALAIEAAANMCRLYARQAQDNPHLDVQGMTYPDMPAPADIGSMKDAVNRDAFVKKGSSTVLLNNGKYEVVDFVTTYHPEGETPAQFRYCRNLNLDDNIRFGYLLLENVNTKAHALVNDGDTVTAPQTVKPKQWKQVLDTYATNLTTRAITVDPEFMQESILVNLGASNPDRLESFFRYKRSGFGRILATTAEANFNLGTP